MTPNKMNGTKMESEPNYDQLPYPSLPIGYTQPGALAAIATLFGATPPDAAKAAVLELGCAAGGNLIPLAARFPACRFLGVDLSERHVKEANERIAKLGLKNIAIHQLDLTRARFDANAYDYIICHGVFSWVPRDAQDAIFRICSESLAPNGIAAVSYNVFPGWHMRRVVRDILLFHADPKASPADRVSRARAALNTIAQIVPGNSPYATLLRNEAKRLATAAASYIHGEFLVEHNAPCYFSEFAARAGQAGLSYLCDGELVTALPDYLSPAVAARVRELSGGNPISLQQYTDFFTGRPFRRSLLVRTANAPKPVLAVDPARARHLHFAADLKRKAGATSAVEAVFVDPKRQEIKVTDPVTIAALDRLAAAFPATLTVDELAAGTTDAQAQTKVITALLSLLGTERATISTIPLKVGDPGQAMPRAWNIARLDATEHRTWATGLHHAAVKLQPPLAFLLPRLTGTADHAALTNAMAEVLAAGKGPAPKAEDLLAQSLSYCARYGLLEP